MRQGRSTTFDWFNKCGGEKAGIDVVIHLKNSRGSIVENFPTHLPLKTELVYDDGSPTPMMPFSPLKERRSMKASLNPLYRPIRPQPVLGPHHGSHFFSFRIEEVSFHHPRKGFKIKVSPADPSCNNVASGTMEETIIVRSKPKSEPDARPKGGRSTPLARSDQGNDTYITSRKEALLTQGRRHKDPATRPRKVSLTDQNILGKANIEDSVAVLTTELLCDTFVLAGSPFACLMCKANLKSTHFMMYQENHHNFCRFVTGVLPNIKLYKSAHSAKEGSTASTSGIHTTDNIQVPNTGTHPLNMRKSPQEE